jgi:hypothetical protein
MKHNVSMHISYIRDCERALWGKHEKLGWENWQSHQELCNARSGTKIKEAVASKQIRKRSLLSMRYNTYDRTQEPERRPGDSQDPGWLANYFIGTDWPVTLTGTTAQPLTLSTFVILLMRVSICLLFIVLILWASIGGKAWWGRRCDTFSTGNPSFSASSLTACP